MGEVWTGLEDVWCVFVCFWVLFLGFVVFHSSDNTLLTAISLEMDMLDGRIEVRWM